MTRDERHPDSWPDPEKQLGEIAEANSWVLRGVGMYGSDVEVVGLDAYLKLAQRCRNAEAAALIWGRKCALLEGRSDVKLEPRTDEDVLQALRLPAAALRTNQAPSDSVEPRANATPGEGAA